MNEIRIGVVEDEMIITDVLVLTLRKLGYKVSFTALNYVSAIKMIDAERPDIVLLDINLGGQKDGIDVAKYIREKYPMLIIFLTANSDAATIQRAKDVKPNAYLLKPFSKDHLYAAIEIAVASQVEHTYSNESILVKDGYHYVKVFLNEIRFVSSDHNYVTLHLDGRKVMVRSTLSEMYHRLDNPQFIKINRGYIVNIHFVTKIETESVFIGEKPFTVNKAQRDMLLQLLEKKLG